MVRPPPRPGARKSSGGDAPSARPVPRAGGNSANVESTNDGMQDLINIINKVQDAFTAIGGSGSIDLPQIAGGQSAGKSSVLENFVGKDFLPRGSGIVTRRPLVLQLQTSDEEYGEFLHAKGQRFAVGDEVRREIEAETDRMTGSNKGISSSPINLKIYSPQVLNLTLIDLPGLTKVAVGDQPVNIEEQIRDMIMEFITKESCIILAVSPANSDLANSDALKMAKEVDPTGVRTIGVITKLDLMDAGTDASEILSNKFLPLRRGYVGVVNRSQKDINGNKDIKAALASERKFFLTNPAYRSLADKMGTKYLQHKLNQQLINHIRDTLPSLKRDLQKNVDELEATVAEIRKSGGVGSTRRNVTLLIKLVNQFSHEFNVQIRGTPTGEGINMKKLYGGARISKVFREKFAFECAKVELDEAELRTEIAFAIRNKQGTRGGLMGFTPEAAFEAIVKKLIEDLQTPCERACELVAEELLTILRDASEALREYPTLREEIEGLSRKWINDCEHTSKEQVRTAVRLELSYINISHPDFQTRKGSQPPGSPGGSNGANSPGTKPELVRKGTLIVTDGKKGMFSKISEGKEYFFVITTTTVTFFKDKTEKEVKGQFKATGLKLNDVDPQNFRIFSQDDAVKLYKGASELNLKCKSKADKEAWEASLLRAGIYPAKERKAADEDSQVGMDPGLQRQVDTIRNLVDAYLRIVTTKMVDTVPKLCMHLIVNSTLKYVEEELMAAIYAAANGDPDSLMNESDECRAEREQAVAIYDASVEALRVINEVTSTTKAEALPPPVENKIRVEPRSSAAPARPGVTQGRSAPPPPGRPGRAPPPSHPARPGRPSRP